MPLYDYVATDSTGREVADLIEAGNAEIAQSKLSQRGLSVTTLTERKPGITPGGRQMPSGNVPAPTRRMEPRPAGPNLVPIVLGVVVAVVGLAIWGISHLANNASTRFDDVTGNLKDSSTSSSSQVAPDQTSTPAATQTKSPAAVEQTAPDEQTAPATASPVVLAPASKPPPPIPATRSLKTGRHAVLVGINQYADPSISALATAEKDAQALHQLLTDPEAGGVPPQNATLLLGVEATREKVIAALAQKKRVAPDSTTFVYFSGHGVTDGVDGYLLLHDSKSDSLEATAISNTDLKVRLGEIPSERKVVILDSCHAAAAIKGAKTKGIADLLERFSARGQATLTASQANELALDVPALGNSLYTHFLVRGLRGEADVNADGVVVLTELTAFLEKHVRNEAIARGGRQTPGQSIDVDIASEFLLTVQPEKRQAFEAQQAEQQKLKASRVKTLKGLVLENKVSQTLGNEGRRLLEADETTLTETEQKLLKEYIDLVEGRLTPDKLEAALNFARGA
jgi:hypothetical protein